MTLKKILLAPLLIFCIGICNAQLIEHVVKSDSTLNENFNYIVDALRPKETKGVVVLLPGLFDSPMSVFFESSLPTRLHELNYAIIIPVLSQKGDRFDLSDQSIRQLGKLIANYIQTSNLAENIPIVLGGFSIGGTRAIKACSVKDSPMNTLNISHLFAIDPPLDLKRLLASEAKYGQNFLKEVLEKEIGELDEEKLASLSLADINNLDIITPPVPQGIKVRIYNEPAIHWQVENRKRDLLDLNLLDQSVYANYIKRKYPDIDIELVLSKIEGVRKQTNDRNPHSWNIVDTDEFIDWLRK